MIVFLFSACSTDSRYESEETIGNPNADILGFRSESVFLDVGGNNGEDGIIDDIFRLGDRYCVLTSFEDDNYIMHTRMVMIDPYTLKAGNPIDTALDNISIWSCCAVGDRYVAVSNGSDVYVLSDDGSVQFEMSFEGGYDNDNGVVNTCRDGFVFINTAMIAKVNEDGKIMDSISLDDIGMPTYHSSYIEQNGNSYIAMTNPTMSAIDYYRLDFDHGSYTKVCDNETFNLTTISVGEYGKYTYSDYYGDLYELDFERGCKEPIAYVKNMLIKPSEGNVTRFLIFDKTTFAEEVSYGGGLYEIVLIVSDESIDLEARKIIRVAGDYATGDKGLVMAAYLYNSSQNEYYVTIDSWGDDNDWETATDGEKRNLRLIKEFQSGTGPDILYGYTLDYNYLGEKGIVVDLNPYIKESRVLTKDKIRDNIFDLMIQNDKCYYLFNGFAFRGLFSSSQYYNDSLSKDVSLYKDPLFQQNYKGRFGSTDIMCNLIGYPLRSVVDLKGFLSAQNLTDALEISIELGLSQEEKNSGLVMDIESDKPVDRIIGGLPAFVVQSDGKNDTYYNYIGYPTYGTVVHPIEVTGMTAVSSGAKYPEECFEFLEFLFSYEAQRSVLSGHNLPVSDEVLDEYIEYMKDPNTIPSYDYCIGVLASELFELKGEGADVSVHYREVTPQVMSNFEAALNSIDSVFILDFGLYNIINEEVESYYLQGKTTDKIADSLRARLLLYADENSIT